MVKHRVLKPAGSDIRLRDSGQRLACWKAQRVTLLASLPPEKLFRFHHALRHPLLGCEHSKRNRKRFFGQASIRTDDAHFRGMSRNVLLEFLKKVGVNNFGRIVRHAFRESLIELQAMTSQAVLRVGDG